MTKVLPAPSTLLTSTCPPCRDTISRTTNNPMPSLSAPEPPAADSPLRSLPNVVYTSHIAGPDTPNLGHQAVNDIATFLAGGRPAYVANAELLLITA